MKNTEDNNQLVLDYHKLGGHMDRVEAWEAGERIAPISVDMSLTRACGAMCTFCYAMVQESQERSSIKELHALNLLDDFKKIGVRSVSLVSDGESTLARAYIPFIKHAKEIGIDVANGTNAWEWDPEKIEEVLPCLTWVRFTVAAGTPEKYASMMYKTSKDVHVFDRAMKNISYAVDLKKRKLSSNIVKLKFIFSNNFI
jgi:MoaA/NifB/PqqE/SkfB family radical SAM enzyme